jgi:hypothetical protein
MIACTFIELRVYFACCPTDGAFMDSNDLRVTLENLTELDRLELEELLGDAIVTIPQSTPSGHLGEPGTLAAVIELSKFAIPTIGACLGIFLAKGRHREGLVDKIEVSNSHGTFRRRLEISTSTAEAVKADVIKELTKAAHSLSQEGGSAASRPAD